MKLKYGEAIQKALFDALEDDDSVVFWGEDDRFNLYGYTEGLFDTFGVERIKDIPLSEAGTVGLACGAAMCGLKPIIDLTTENFLYVAMDQICSIAAKVSYMNNDNTSVPITIFCSAMNVGGNAAQHSDRLHSLFMNVAGLKIICPSTPQDMYSMLRAAISDPNPVICFADRALFWMEGDVNYNKRGVIGKANVITQGTDITLVTVSGCYRYVKEILEECGEDISVEWIDVRSVVPLDIDTIMQSIRKTGRIVICDTANRTGSLAGHIASLLSQNAFEYLDAPIGIAAAKDVPIPYAKNLEAVINVSKDDIMHELKRVMDYGKKKA